jgi:hypothetical protein
MPNRWVRDANNVLVPKVSVGGLPDGTVVNADIADGTIANVKLVASTIEAGKLDYFKSAETTGTASEQNIAHGLARTPSLVLVIPTEDTGLAGTLDILEGTHDGTNVKVTAPATLKFVVFAL